MTDERIVDLLKIFATQYHINETYKDMKPLYMRCYQECLYKEVTHDIYVEEIFIRVVLSHFTNYGSEAYEAFRHPN